MAFPAPRRARFSPAKAVGRGPDVVVAVDAGLARAEWQPTLFADPPRRAELLALRANWPLKPFGLQVIRNQPFEFVASVLRPFLAFAGLEPVIRYGDYDDSLAVRPDPSAAIILVWIDFTRYERLSPGALVDWLGTRLEAVRAGTSAPILVANHAAPDGQVLNEGLERLASAIPGTYIANQAAIAERLGPAYRDERTARIAGTTMSDRAALLSARHMGLSWIPALLQAPIKAVAVDLDGTLYDGVLAEDGPQSLRTTDDHLALQRKLLQLRERGIFLAAVTRNETEDVRELFIRRTDFPIRLEHFSATAISWGPKAAAIERIADQLRIGSDAILYLDDNPGELASVAAAVPGIRLLHAANPALSSRALEDFPGLFRWSTSNADALRVADLAAAQRRDQLLTQSPDLEAYLASLQVEIAISVDEPGHLDRLHNLSQKTNQFNTGLRRFAAAEVASYIQEPNHHAVSIALRDRLSDSGIVGAVFITVQGGEAIIDEVAISCRALGRQLERLMIFAAINQALGERTPSRVTFTFTPGPRNEPARTWLRSIDGSHHWNGSPQKLTMSWRPTDVEREIESAPVHVIRSST